MKTFLPNLLSAAVAVALTPTMAYADESPKLQIEEVVVTARKRQESAQDIPLALTAMSGEDLAINGINDMTDLQAHTSSLTIYAARGTSSTATAYIRGIGQSDPLWGVEPGVGIYINDVYLARPQSALLDMLDVERIEILRGPQGTLYGRNTIGGAIKYITKRPSDTLTATTDFAVGSYNQQDFRGAISGPIIDDKLLGSFSVGTFNHDGYGENRLTGRDVSDKELHTARVNVVYIANDNFEIDFSADGTWDRSNVRGTQRMVPNTYELYFEGNPPLAVSDDRYDVDNGFEDQDNSSEAKGAALTFRYSGDGAWSAKSITAWRDGDTDGAIDFDAGPYPIADVDAIYFDTQISQEFQLNYDSDTLQAVLGLYFMDAEAGGRIRNRFALPAAALGLAPPTTIPGPIITIYGESGGQIDTQSMALFGDMSWQATDALTVSLGLRIGRETKEADVLNQGFTDDTFVTPNGAVTANFENEETWTDASPRISIDYKVADDQLVYASISKGFKSGGFNIRANTVQVPRSGDPYEPESVVAYEMGYKSTFADRFQFNLAAFHNDYEDIQLSIFTGVDTTGDGNLDSFFGDFTNAGQGTIDGLEFEFTWAVADNFDITGNAAYLDANFDEYISGGVDVSDDREFTDTPELAYGIHAKWFVELDSSSITSHLGYSWRDDVQPVTNQSDLIYQEAYGLWNAKVSWNFENGLLLALEGKNLADEEYRTTGYDLRDAGFPIVTGFYGPPRTLTARIGYSF